MLYKLILLMIEPYKHTGMFKTDLLLIGSVNQELFTKQRITRRSVVALFPAIADLI